MSDRCPECDAWPPDHRVGCGVESPAHVPPVDVPLTRRALRLVPPALSYDRRIEMLRAGHARWAKRAGMIGVGEGERMGEGPEVG